MNNDDIDRMTDQEIEDLLRSKRIKQGKSQRKSFFSLARNPVTGSFYTYTFWGISERVYQKFFTNTKTVFQASKINAKRQYRRFKKWFWSNGEGAWFTRIATWYVCAVTVMTTFVHWLGPIMKWWFKKK